VGIVNRRNAVMGWLAWTVGKRVMRKKAKDAVPAIDRESRRPNRSAIVSAAAAFVGVLWFWRKRGDGGEAGGPPGGGGD
jgi:hypothetical protein